jgi:hypothetical protein
VDNYSRVIPLRSAVPSPGSPRNNKSNSVVSKGIPASATKNKNSSPPPSTFLVTHNRVLLESLEKLAQQIQMPLFPTLSLRHVVPHPSRWNGRLGLWASPPVPRHRPDCNRKTPNFQRPNHQHLPLLQNNNNNKRHHQHKSMK